jgi:hypothetical protein
MEEHYGGGTPYSKLGALDDYMEYRNDTIIEFLQGRNAPKMFPCAQ